MTDSDSGLLLPEPNDMSVGIDWLTLTFPPTSWTYNNIITAVKNARTELLPGGGHGFETKIWRGLGYAGWQHGPIKCGRREDSAILIISGETAGKACDYPDLEEARCTRIDIKFDLFYSNPKPALTEIADMAARIFRQGQNGRPFVIDHRQPDPGAPTLYLGRRGSPLFIRLYDKEAESSGDRSYTGCWRLEAEIKEEEANETFHGLRAGLFDNRMVCDTGVAIFESRGLRIAGQRHSEGRCFRPGQQGVTDAFRKLDWIERMVQPTVRWLLRNAPEKDILAALGLQDVAVLKGG